MTSEPGITKGATLNQGPGKIGKRDGYRHRFTFTNPTTTLTAEVAAVPSGPTTPNPDGTFGSPSCWPGCRTSQKRPSPTSSTRS